MTTPVWDRYVYGRSPSQTSLASNGSRVRFSEGTQAQADTGGVNIPDNGQNDSRELRRRRSSISIQFDNLRHAGGLNSLDNFARSWQRATGFLDLPSRSPSHLVSTSSAGDEESLLGYRAEAHRPAGKSLLREHLESGTSPESAVEDQSEGEEQSGRSPSIGPLQDSPRPSAGNENDLVSIQPHLASPLEISGGTSYGSIISRPTEPSMLHASRLWREQQTSDGGLEADKDQEQLLVKSVEREDGKLTQVVVGQSTLPQTVTNCGNTLIGIGILSLPLAVRYAGWLVGMVGLLVSAAVTSYTARVLGRCMDVDKSVITFGDLASLAFGPKMRAVISPLFCLELLGANVALVLLFGDSLSSLVPSLGSGAWKIVCGLILVPMGFLPLRALSMSSALGLLCCFGVIAIVFVDGIMKQTAPGSFREPAKTHLFPDNWMSLPLSFGLIMAPWGGHGVFPTIYRDMRHPHKYHKALNITYTFTYLMDLSMAVAGYIMFGDGVLEEITQNVLVSSSYSKALSVLTVIFVAIIPITKAPLNTRPIISTIEIYAGLDSRMVPNNQDLAGMSGFTRGFVKFAIRVGANILYVLLAILIPSFDRIMALLGAALCFTICIILPLAFELRIFKSEMSIKKKVMNWIIICICSVLALLGTIWACLPKHLNGTG